MNQTLIRNVNIWTMDEEDTRFYGWVLLENGKIASMGEGEPPAMPVQIDGDVVYGEGGVLTPGLIDIHGLLVLICTDVGNYSFTFVSVQLHDTCAYVECGSFHQQ